MIEPAPGRSFGDFELTRELGRGGMGTVWEANQISLGRRVALKILSPHIAISPTSLKRFQREAEAGARLTHRNIVAVHAVGEDEGTHYIAQELVEGGVSLADRIKADRELPDMPKDYYENVAKIFAQVTDALQAAHEGGITHRDVKPANILLTKDGEPKVADFGLAQVEDALELSRTGEFAGTPFYMSPEQAMSNRIGIDHRTDIFSLGVSLWEVLALQRPFEGDTSQQILKKIITEPPIDPRKIKSKCPGPLAIICLKAMEKETARRFQSMEEFSADLRRFLADEPIMAKPPSLFYKGWKWVCRNSMASLSLAAIVLGLVSSLALWQRAANSNKTAIAAVEALGEMIAALAPTGESNNPQRTQELLVSAEKNIRSKVVSPIMQANVLTTLAKATREAGDYWKALKLLDEAFVIYKENGVTGGENIITAQAYRANTLMMLEEYDEGKKAFQDLLEAQKEFYGEDSVGFYIALSGLGVLEDKSGDHEAAEILLVKAYDGLKETLGMSNLTTIGVLSNLCLVYRSLGKSDKAGDGLKLVAAERKKLLGDKHPETRRAESNLLAHRTQIQKDMAKRVEALEGQIGGEAVRVAPADYSETVDSFTNLVESQKETLGPDHPETLFSSHNLILSLQDSGRRVEAETLAKDTLFRLRSSLGGTHPLTLGTMSVYAGLSEYLMVHPPESSSADDVPRRAARASELHKEAVDGAREKLGLMHPVTNDIIFRYAVYLKQIKEYQAGVDMAKLILPGHIKNFGEGGAYTLELKKLINFLETKVDLMTAWSLVNPLRKDEDTNVARGLSLIQDAMEAYPAGELCHHNGDCPNDTLAWALFANGRYEEAIVASKLSLELAPQERKEKAAGYLEHLERMIAAVEK
jgi:serine/threonine protein kinase